MGIMKDKCKNGDIFYVRNGCWEGVYNDKSKTKHNITIYHFSIKDRLEKGDVAAISSSESETRCVDDEYMDSLDIKIIGNVFDMVKAEVENAKEELEDAKDRFENIEKFSKELPNLVSSKRETRQI